MVFPFIEVFLLTISSILIAVILSANRSTYIFRTVSFAFISFYVLILLFFHISGYIDLFFNCGIKKPFFIAVFLFALLILFLFLKKEYHKKYTQSVVFKIDDTDKTIIYLYCIFYACLILHKLITYPTSWDGNAYHLPLAIKFVQSDSLSNVPPIWQFSMPSNAELIFSYFSAFRIPILLNFTQIFLLFGLIIWSYDFNRKYLKLKQSASLLAVVTLLSMPCIFQGAFDHYVDFFGAVFLYFSLTTSLLLIIDDKKYLIKYSFLSGLFYGVSVGTKINFIVFCPAVGLILLYALFIKKKNLSYKDSLKTFLSFIFGFILLSSFWFVRNYFLFDNPLFPLNVPFLNFEGIPIEKIANMDYESRFIQGGKWEWIFYPFTERHPTGRYVYSYGPLFAITVLPSYIISLIYSACSIKSKESKNLIFLNIIVAICIILWFLFLSRQPRFIIISPIIMVSTVGFAFDHVIKNKKRIFKYITISFSLLCFTLYSFEFIQPISYCIRYKYSPLNWDAYYKIPVDSTIVEKRGIINLNDEWQNFALYGPKFRNEVITTQEVRGFNKASPPYNDNQIYTLYQKYGEKLFYSNKKLSNNNLTIFKAGIQTYPNIKWLENYLYEFKKN